MEPALDPTDNGTSHTPTPDSQQRRSSRLASRSNLQNTREATMDNSQNASLPERPKGKPKIILYHKTPKTADKATGDTSPQIDEHTNTGMPGPSDERPRKARRVSGKKGSRRASDLAILSEETASEPGPISSGGLTISDRVGPATGHDDRFGSSGPPPAPGPSSAQNKSSRGRKTSNKVPGTESKCHRIPGMPSAMPRSDTPPPQFDTTNPYSAFSNQPAIAQRRPSASEPIVPPPTRPHPLPLPNSAPQTSASKGSGQQSHAAGGINYRDPSWRHPWRIPVEPLPPVPPRYITPKERIKIAGNFEVPQPGDEVYGLDEHIPLGDHPIDIEFAQYLIENQRRENESEHNLNHPRGSDLGYPEYASLPGPQPVTPNTQHLPVAGDQTAFPNYPYGFDQYSLDPISLRVHNKPSVPLILERLTDNAQSLANSESDKEDIRRSALAASIMGSLVSGKAKADMSKGKAKGKAPASRKSQQIPQSQTFQQTQQGHQRQSSSNLSRDDLKGLALAKLKTGKVSPTGEPTCTFCRYECDLGISSDSFLLNAEASTGSCHECSNPSAGSFFDEFTSILESRDNESSRAVLEEINEPVLSQPAPQHGPTVYSSIDGIEITNFMGPMFCKTCPWGQIDVERVRICGPHRSEKYAIVKHHRHQNFRQIGYSAPGDLLPAENIRGMNMNDAEDRLRADVIKGRELDANYIKNRRCMVCTGHAIDVCADCPLRLCSTCSTFLKSICKGYLDNLFYHYDRQHIRNDAFLLRSDGGGF